MQFNILRYVKYTANIALYVHAILKFYFLTLNSKLCTRIARNAL